MTATADLGLVHPAPGPDYAPLALERVLTRINELVVGRADTGVWWSALARTVDQLAEALTVHRAVALGRGGLHGEILEEQPRLAFEVRSLERDHDELATDVVELRTLIGASMGRSGGVALVIAATTEVVARIRGHERRLATVLHEAYQRDLGGGD